MDSSIEAPRYQFIHDRLRDPVGQFNLPTFRSQFYFLQPAGRAEFLVVLDEIQRRPDLFPVLRVLADRRPLPTRFLVLGSASPELLKQTSETLAGPHASST